MANIESLVKRLILLPCEQEWLEFKTNNADPQMIGEDISALANGAAFCDRSKAYLIWGIDDKTHQIVGTTFNPETAKKGNQDLSIWLRTQLSDNADFCFEIGCIENKPIVVLIITRAVERTVMFNRTEYIRVGSHTKKLNDVSNMKATLWDHLRNSHFEILPAMQNLALTDVMGYLNVPAYFELQNKPMPAQMESMAHYLCEDAILIRQDDGQYSITNLGALLLAKQVTSFPTVSRKAVRVVQYKGENRLEMLRESTEGSGYAICYENVMKYILALLPAREMMEDGRRSTVFAYPPIAIREAMANTLIHQDFSVKGAGPLIEIFADRIEMTNPGSPLVDVARIIDNPPRSRNEKLAALMRRFHICEESGTGWDKIIISCELQHLPAPKIDVYEDNTKVTLYSTMDFSNMQMEDKLWACYMHACIRFVENKQMNNSSLRERFGLDNSYKSSVSRIIKVAVDRGMIKQADPTTAPRYMRYIPTWA